MTKASIAAAVTMDRRPEARREERELARSERSLRTLTEKLYFYL
jgi:hypothetical protein